MEPDRYKIKIISHTKIDTHTEYLISIENKEGSFTFQDRYSNLKALNDLLKKATNNNAFPKFPGKKFFGTEDEKFIIKRQKDINNYFEIISNHPEFSRLPPLLKFIQEKKEKFDASKSKSNAQNATPPPIVKKESEKKSEKDAINKKESKKSEDDYTKIVDSFTSQFYDMNTFYDKDMTNDNKNFINFFKENKISISDNTNFAPGDENNFSYINKVSEENKVFSIETKIKEKIKEVSELYKSLDELYDTKGIIVSI